MRIFTPIYYQVCSEFTLFTICVCIPPPTAANTNNNLLIFLCQLPRASVKFHVCWFTLGCTVFRHIDVNKRYDRRRNWAKYFHGFQSGFRHDLHSTEQCSVCACIITCGLRYGNAFENMSDFLSSTLNSLGNTNAQKSRKCCEKKSSEKLNWIEYF